MANSYPIILATAGYDHNIRLWQANTGVCLKILNHNKSVKKN
jgi:WD40 repeat protein